MTISEMKKTIDVLTQNDIEDIQPIAFRFITIDAEGNTQEHYRKHITRISSQIYPRKNVIIIDVG